MAKPEVMRRKQAMAEERRRREDAALAARTFAENQAGQEKEPRIALTRDGAFCNLPWLRHWMSGLETPAPSLPIHDLPGLGGGWIAFSDLEDALDLGRFSETVMGSLEIFTITDFARLGPWDAKLLGIPRHPEDALDPGKRHAGLAALFEAAEPLANDRPIEVLSSWHSNASAWAAGKPTLQACLPLEVCYDHRCGAVLYARSLKDAVAPAEAPQSEAAQPAAEAGAGGADQQAPDAVPAHAVTTAAAPNTVTPEEAAEQRVGKSPGQPFYPGTGGAV